MTDVKPRRRKCCQRCRLFIWNPRQRLICRRHGVEWVQFFIFYFGFLVILVFLTGILSIIAIYFMDRFETPWTLTNIVAKHPDLWIRPVGKQRLIIYDPEDIEMSPSSYVHNISNFLKAYQKQDKNNFQNCSESCLNSPIPCYFDLTNLGPCAKEPYGYDTMTPCVLIKPNKNYGSLRCPPKSRKHKKSSQVDNVEVKCSGHKPADSEHFSAVNHYPATGFPISFFPFSGQKHYLSPLVAIQVQDPLVGVLITIECTSTYQGEKVGTLIFQILVGDK